MINLPLLTFVFAPILVGLIYYVSHFKFLKICGLVTQFVLLVSLLLYQSQLALSQEIVQNLSHFLPPVGMYLKIDALSYMLLLLNNFIFLMMSIFSYRKDYNNYLFIFLFMSLQGIINGVFLSTDFFNIYLLIELATIIVSILIMFKKDGRSFYDGMIYLIINMVGMAFFLMGVAYLYKSFGVLDFDSIKTMISAYDQKSLILPFAFLMTGASLKAAFMPLFSWLPKAHGTASAPTVVSAILSGIFVKTGIYLFIRISVIFLPVLDLSNMFLIVGIFTVLIGGIFAFSQSDIKLILSYSTISQVGLIMIGLTQSEITQAVSKYYVLNHGITKALLFVVAGILIELYGTRDIRKMKGLYKHSPVLSFVLCMILLTISANPILGTGHLKLYLNKFLSHQNVAWVYYLMVLSTMMYLIPILRIVIAKAEGKKKLSIYPEQKFVLGVMTTSIILLGIFSKVIIESLFDYSVQWSLSNWLEKQVVYFGLLLLAYGLHMIIGQRRNIRDKIEKIDFSFNTINGAILSYFMILIFSRIV